MEMGNKDEQEGQQRKLRELLFVICAYIIGKNVIGPYSQAQITKTVSRIFKDSFRLLYPLNLFYFFTFAETGLRTSDPPESVRLQVCTTAPGHS